MIPLKNNINFVMVNNLSSNGSLNFGNEIHKGHSANAQSVGGQTLIGNRVANINTDFELNIVADPDAVDQPQYQL